MSLYAIAAELDVHKMQHNSLFNVFTACSNTTFIAFFFV